MIQAVVDQLDVIVILLAMIFVVAFLHLGRHWND